MSHYVNSCYSTDMDKFYAVYLSVILIIVGKQTCMILRDLHHTPSMVAYKMIRLKFELACKSSLITYLLTLTYLQTHRIRKLGTGSTIWLDLLSVH